MRNNSNVIVVDSIMGSGKTSWAIQQINSSHDENVLYITPFLNECDRILQSTTRGFKQPQNKGEGKLASLNSLLSAQENIVSTHVLFSNLDEVSREYIKKGNYTLYLDEVLNVVEPYSLKKNDMQILKDSNCINVDDKGYLIWNQDKINYNSQYDEVKLLAENHSLINVNNVLLLWEFPPEIFSLFKKVYILSYLFEGSILKYYFDLHGINYSKKSVQCKNEEYKLTDFILADTSLFYDKVNIYEGKLNDNYYQERKNSEYSRKVKDNALSASWFKSSNNAESIKRIKNNFYNYFGNIVRAKSGSVLWTTFKDYQSKLKGKGYSKGFLSCNCRSTNEYSDTYNLAYGLNVYLHPAINQYFLQNNIVIDQGLYATAEMIQWIWRSRIRKNETINIYIPSKRMRGLLYSWLECNIDGIKLKAS